MNKRAAYGELIRIIMWIVFASILLLGLYFLIGRFI